MRKESRPANDKFLSDAVTTKRTPEELLDSLLKRNGPAAAAFERLVAAGCESWPLAGLVIGSSWAPTDRPALTPRDARQLAQGAERLARQLRTFQERAARGNRLIDFATEIASVEAAGKRLRQMAASFDSRKSNLRNAVLKMLLIYVQEHTHRACTSELSEILGVTTNGIVTEMTLKKTRSKSRGHSAAGPDWHGVMKSPGSPGRPKAVRVTPLHARRRPNAARR